MKTLILSIFYTAFLTACSASINNCEKATEIAEQLQQCQVLHQQIMSLKDSPIKRAEVERRYQKDCIDVRYYRDDRQLAICENKTAVKENL